MFRFNREKILAAFLQKQWTTAELARCAGVSFRSAFRAVNGLPINGKIVAKVARALEVDAVATLAAPAQI